VIEHQISEIDESGFSDAKNILIETKEVLDQHYTPLNNALDQLERDAELTRKITAEGNGDNSLSLVSRSRERERISSLLRNNYSALNLITMGNTLLHTTALALGCQEVALIALKHLENLAPLVVKMGALLPDVAIRELRRESADIDLAIAAVALKNTQAVWRTLS
jgi:hypothetical protein